MTAIPHGRPPFRHPGCSGHCAAQNPTPLSTLKFHDWRSSGRRFAGHFVSGYTDDVRFGSKADMCSAKGHVRFTPESGHVRCNSGCPLCANSGHVARRCGRGACMICVEPAAPDCHACGSRRMWPRQCLDTPHRQSSERMTYMIWPTRNVMRLRLGPGSFSGSSATRIMSSR